MDSHPGPDPLSYFQDRASEVAASVASQTALVARRTREISKELSLSLEATQELAIEDTGISLNTKEKDLLLLDDGPLGYKTIDVWIAAISELFEQQKSLAKNIYESYREDAFKQKINNLKNIQFNTKRKNFANRGINRLSNSYSDDEFLAINRYLL
jgi:hypothetical protein